MIDVYGPDWEGVVESNMVTCPYELFYFSCFAEVYKMYRSTPHLRLINVISSTSTSLDRKMALEALVGSRGQYNG